MERIPNDCKVSVIMPAYNAEKYIYEAVESILHQTYQNFELLIGDDASKDSTPTIISSFNDQRIKFFQNKENLKKPGTCNYLFEHSTGSLITIHDADDTSHPERLEKMVRFFHEHPNIAMCGHSIQRITEKGELLPLYRKKSLDDQSIRKEMAYDNISGDASMMFRREIVSEIGGLLRTYFPNNMDYDLALRIMEKYKVANLPEVLLYYRNVPDSISKHISGYKKLTTQQMTQFLAQQRQEKGTDALMEKDWDLIQVKEKEFATPYIQDPSLFLRETAARFMYLQMNHHAIKAAWHAVKKEPFKLINLRTLQYCLRKSYLKF